MSLSALVARAVERETQGAAQGEKPRRGLEAFPMVDRGGFPEHVDQRRTGQLLEYLDSLDSDSDR